MWNKLSNMKKQYVKPQMEAVIINGMQLMSTGSSVHSVNGNVFKSGVSGGNGDARSRSCSWDDEE